jgi:hypothetical protein
LPYRLTVRVAETDREGLGGRLAFGVVRRDVPHPRAVRADVGGELHVGGDWVTLASAGYIDVFRSKMEDGRWEMVEGWGMSAGPDPQRTATSSRDETMRDLKGAEIIGGRRRCGFQNANREAARPQGRIVMRKTFPETFRKQLGETRRRADRQATDNHRVHSLRWFAQTLSVLSRRMTRRTLPESLDARRRTSPVPRSFHSSSPLEKRKSLARLRSQHGH